MDLLRNSHSRDLPLSPPVSLFLLVASLTSLIASVSMGRFMVNAVIASAGTSDITAHALDLQTAYLSEISPPTPISVPEPAGWIGLMACAAMLCVLARRRNTGRS